MRLFKTCLLLATFTVTAWSQFLLSELHTQSPNSIRWIYSYDSQGNRIEQDIYDGERLNSTTVYNYNSNKQVISELVKVTDTISLALYSYNKAGQLMSVSVYGKGLQFRYCDSLFYEKGLFTEQARYNRVLVKTSYHRFFYNSLMQKTSDSTYEKGRSGFASVRVVDYLYGSNGKIEKETVSRKYSGVWYLQYTSQFVYDTDFLKSMTVYESSVLVDSFAYFYDRDGNKSREEHYNDERELIERIDYTWGSISYKMMSRAVGVVPEVMQNKVLRDKDLRGYRSDEIVIYDVRGRVVPLSSYLSGGHLVYVKSLGQCFKIINYQGGACGR